MKKLYILISTIIIALTIQSCTWEIEPENPFLGAWYYTAVKNQDGVAVNIRYTYTFFDDNTMVHKTDMTAVGYIPQSYSDTYKYEYDDKQIIMWYTEDSGATFDYNITGNKMKWQNHYHPEESVIVFTKE